MSVYVVLFRDKHSDAMESVDVYSTRAAAEKSIADAIIPDVKRGRYCDDEEREKLMLAAIEREEWAGLLQVHFDYWAESVNPEEWVVHEAEVKD